MRVFSVQRQRGFTLIELMVVVTIIGILSTTGISSFQKIRLEAKLNEAKPYMTEIMSRERIYRMRQGSYYTDATYTEQNLVTNLGVSLKDSGDFCYVVRCPSCNPVAGTAVAVAAATDNAIEFEVWAILRQDPTVAATVAIPGGGNCTMATNKLLPTGWVSTVAAGGRGSQGRIVVLRYPPPADRLDDPVVVPTVGTVPYNWVLGFSTTNAMAP